LRFCERLIKAVEGLDRAANIELVLCGERECRGDVHDDFAVVLNCDDGAPGSLTNTGFKWMATDQLTGAALDEFDVGLFRDHFTEDVVGKELPGDLAYRECKVGSRLLNTPDIVFQGRAGEDWHIGA